MIQPLPIDHSPKSWLGEKHRSLILQESLFLRLLSFNTKSNNEHDLWTLDDEPELGFHPGSNADRRRKLCKRSEALPSPCSLSVLWWTVGLVGPGPTLFLWLRSGQRDVEGELGYFGNWSTQNVEYLLPKQKILWPDRSFILANIQGAQWCSPTPRIFQGAVSCDSPS